MFVVSKGSCSIIESGTDDRSEEADSGAEYTDGDRRAAAAAAVSGAGGGPQLMAGRSLVGVPPPYASLFRRRAKNHSAATPIKTAAPTATPTPTPTFSVLVMPEPLNPESELSFAAPAVSDGPKEP